MILCSKVRFLVLNTLILKGLYKCSQITTNQAFRFNNSLLVINKIDIAQYVGADVDLMVKEGKQVKVFLYTARPLAHSYHISSHSSHPNDPNPLLCSEVN